MLWVAFAFGDLLHCRVENDSQRPEGLPPFANAGRNGYLEPRRQRRTTYRALQNTDPLVLGGPFGLLDDSKEYGTGCWKVVLDVGAPRVALYYSSDDEERIEKLKKGQSLSFEDCAGISIKSWGFWSTATCDMPRL